MPDRRPCHSLRSRWTLGFILPFLVSPVVEADDRFEFSRLIMGVEARIVLYAPNRDAAVAAAEAGFSRLIHLDQVLSDYKPDSELMRLCDAAGQGVVPVSDDLYACVAAALEMHAKTGGAFDPTCGPLVAVWRRARRNGEVPDASAIREVLGLVDARRVALDPDAPEGSAAREHSIELSQPGMRLDMGGIGKGFAAHEAAKVVKGRGFGSCLVALAGDIFTVDPPPGRRGWDIAISSGIPSDASDIHLVLSNLGVSTSGDAEQFIEVDGVRYSHVIDPRTGRALTRRVAATVVAADGATADGLGTALCVLGIDEGPPRLAAFPGVGVRIVEDDGATVRVGVNPAFCAHLRDRPSR